MEEFSFEESISEGSQEICYGFETYESDEEDKHEEDPKSKTKSIELRDTRKETTRSL